MAGSKVSDYGIGDSNIQSVMLTLDKAYKGYHQVSLTNYNLTTESAIAAGSVVECNGALYKFDSEEAITGTPSDGTVYIQLVPDGDSITAAYTNTAPTWSDSKQGWYGTGGSANYRYLKFVLTLSSSSWLYKQSLSLFSNNRLNSCMRAQLTSTQNLTASSIIHFDSEIINYNLTLGEDYKVQITDSGLYSLYFQISASGTPAGTSTLYSLNTDSGNSILSGFISYGPTPAPFDHCAFPFDAGDKVWVYYTATGTAPNLTVSTDSYFIIKKIGEL